MGTLLTVAPCCIVLTETWVLRPTEEGDQPECASHQEMASSGGADIANRGEPVEEGDGGRVEPLAVEQPGARVSGAL